MFADVFVLRSPASAAAWAAPFPFPFMAASLSASISSGLRTSLSFAERMPRVSRNPEWISARATESGRDRCTGPWSLPEEKRKTRCTKRPAIRAVGPISPRRPLWPLVGLSAATKIEESEKNKFLLQMQPYATASE